MVSSVLSIFVFHKTPFLQRSVNMSWSEAEKEDEAGMALSLSAAGIKFRAIARMFSKDGLRNRRRLSLYDIIMLY